MRLRVVSIASFGSSASAFAVGALAAVACSSSSSPSPMDAGALDASPLGDAEGTATAPGLDATSPNEADATAPTDRDAAADDAGAAANADDDAATDGGSDAGTTDAGAAFLRVCDIKRPLAGFDATPALSEANYAVILGALKNQLGCSIVRLYIDPSISDPSTYPQLYQDVLQYARSSLGLKIFANPLGTGTFGFSNADYASWIVAYANYVKPHYLGPFNESSFGDANLVDIAARVRAGLSYDAILVGPDAQKVAGTQALLAADASLPTFFDIFSSHNANDDEGATATAWSALVQGALGRPFWSSENPRPLHLSNDAGADIGVAAAVAGGVNGVDLYEAFPSSVLADGGLTPKGAALASGLPVP